MQIVLGLRAEQVIKIFDKSFNLQNDTLYRLSNIHFQRGKASLSWQLHTAIFSSGLV